MPAISIPIQVRNALRFSWAAASKVCISPNCQRVNIPLLNIKRKHVGMIFFQFFFKIITHTSSSTDNGLKIFYTLQDSILNDAIREKGPAFFMVNPSFLSTWGYVSFFCPPAVVIHDTISHSESPYRFQTFQNNTKRLPRIDFGRNARHNNITFK